MPQNRRQFIISLLRSATSVALLGGGVGLYSQRAASLPAQAIRPPGALPEDAFTGACIRCGICVRDCPYDILKLAEIGDDVATGTPFFTARTSPCEMCEDIPCISHCPTHALDHELDDINDARMGLAVVSDQETCIAFLGLRCEVCFNICPLKGQAITLAYRHNERSGKHAQFIPIVHSTACTGCGLCEKACILDEAAIKVLPNHLVQGELGEHYRIGWKQKEAIGGSLVTPDSPHQYNLPEGVFYDHGGEGLMVEPDLPATSPFSDNPLDTLNRKGKL